ncbi:MAG: MBL fold metallo-hydrolase [Anaerolineales bacterium]|nr:MBL fold metallo-hydrolase [Anaerolineales bacterium]
MQITFHGAAQTVTGSQHLVEVNGRCILLDCGLYQGQRAEARARNQTFRFDPPKLDAVVLSHAHIDHSGNLPSLAKQGYRGPVYATPATRDLCEHMLRDAARIQESDVEFYNRKAVQRGDAPDAEALYTEEDAAAALALFRTHPLDRPFEVAPGVVCTFREAGHILGSAMVVLDIEEKSRRLRLAFSGDLGRLGLPILNDPVFLQDVDYLIMECTYGRKIHRPPEEAEQEFRALVQATVARGGKIIVPAFAVGRTQEIVYYLNKMIRAGEVPAIPVFVDSPLAVDVSAVFRAHAELFDAETRRLLHENGDAFGFKSLRYTRTVEESKAINDVRGPCVIISPSGMAESGRILHHLKHNIEEPRNTVLIVSWQAPHTLGRRLAERESQVKIFGEWYKLRAQVATINGLSGHAGCDLLLRWAAALKPRVKNVFLVHGEPEAASALKASLETEGLRGVHAPVLHESVAV